MTDRILQVIEISAYCFQKGEKVYRRDEPTLALQAGEDQFVSWEDLVDELSEFPKREADRPEVPIGFFKEKEPEPYYPVLDEFWGLEVSYMGEAVGSDRSCHPLDHELDCIGWDEILCPKEIMTEINALITKVQARREKRDFHDMLVGGPKPPPEPISIVRYMALVECVYWTESTENGTEYESEINYLGRIDPCRLTEILA